MTAINATPAPRKRNRAIAIGLAAAILTAGVAGAAVQTTGAWFTATKTATGNTVSAGTLSLGNLGDSATGLVQASNAYPMTDAQAINAADTAIPAAVIKIRNTGSLPLTASAVLSNLLVKSTTGASLSPSNVKVSVWNGTAWGTPVLLSSIVTTPPAQFTVTNLAAQATSEIKLRVFFAGATTDDTYQGATVSFDANATAMQINKQ